MRTTGGNASVEDRKIGMREALNASWSYPATAGIAERMHHRGEGALRGLLRPPALSEQTLELSLGRAVEALGASDEPIAIANGDLTASRRYERAVLEFLQSCGDAGAANTQHERQEFMR